MLPGIGEKSIEQLRKGIKESLGRPFATVLSSLGIPEIGKKSAALLVTGGFDSMDSILNAADRGDTAAFSSIPGFGEVTGERIVAAFRSEHLRTTIEALRKAGVQMAAEEEEVMQDLLLHKKELLNFVNRGNLLLKENLF